MGVKAERLINALQRLYKHLDFKSCMAIFKSLYLPISTIAPCMDICDQGGFRCSGKIQERVLRFIHNDYVSDKRLLLEQYNAFLFTLSLYDALHSKCLNAWLG